MSNPSDPTPATDGVEHGAMIPPHLQLAHELPKPPAPRHFLLFSLLPTMFAFFLASASVELGPSSTLQLIVPLLLTTFAVMIFRGLDAAAIELFQTKLQRFESVAPTVTIYISWEFCRSRNMFYWCIINGLLALTFYFCFRYLPEGMIADPWGSLFVAAFCIGAFLQYCGALYHLGSIAAYVRELRGIEFLNHHASDP